MQLDPAIRDQVAADLLEQEIYTTLRYPPLHKVPAYQAQHLALPGTEACAESTLLLPLHQGLDDTEVHSIAAALRKSVEYRSRAIAS